MAGSYEHCLHDDGSFTMDTIENMGDAHEALEEMFYMIEFFSKKDQKLIDLAKKYARKKCKT